MLNWAILKKQKLSSITTRESHKIWKKTIKFFEITYSNSQNIWTLIWSHFNGIGKLLLLWISKNGTTMGTTEFQLICKCFFAIFNSSTKPTKNRPNYHSIPSTSLSNCYCSFFGRIEKTPKSQFEITWPSVPMSHSFPPWIIWIKTLLLWLKK